MFYLYGYTLDYLSVYNDKFKIKEYKKKMISTQLIEVMKKYPAARFANNKEKHEMGKTYFCNYWRQYYTVIDIKNTACGEYYVCKWEDGHINSHCTQLEEYRDIVCN
jgi:hypothetical protein